MTDPSPLSLPAMQHFFVDAVPFNRQLGIRVVGARLGPLLFDLPFSLQLATDATGPMHEGEVTTVLDSACGCVLLSQQARLRRAATAVSRTRRFANVRVITDQDRPEEPRAAATAQFLLVD